MSRTSIDVTLIPNIAKYRRPNLVYSSGTVVTLETGIVDGTSGDAIILFPDGNLRTETSSSRYNMTITQNAVFNNATLGNNQGGLRTGSVTANTWYACYAVKVTTFAANWVMVADTVLPLQANYSTLNTNFGTNSWVYLGTVPYGDNAGATTSIPKFVMSGHRIAFYNAATGNAAPGSRGVRLTTTTGATTLTWTYATGTSLSSGQVPTNTPIGDLNANVTDTAFIQILDSTGALDVQFFGDFSPANSALVTIANHPLTLGLRSAPSTSTSQDIWLSGYVDQALGVGSNPLL